MPINPSLLIAAPMLQDYLVDKDSGLPLSGGIISLYKDDDRQIYKNWYYQTGIPGAYTWIPLDNPLHLSLAGTIQDPNGNDVIPFYYPYQENEENISEAYYITVYSSDYDSIPEHLQFTRENFPYNPIPSFPTSMNPTFRNYILNNIYWRNVGTLVTTTILNQVIAPSQHEGYVSFGDIRFIKNIAGGIDSISFLPMTTTLNGDITPEFYLNYNCTGAQAGETQKCIQYPISLHVDTLNSVQATVTIQAQNVAGNPNNYLTIYIWQYTGTGALSPSTLVPFGANGGIITLGNTFDKYTITDFLPSSEGLTLGTGGDDALFLVVQYPLAVTSNINHTKPEIYLSTEVPDNDFDTYDQVETIINSPRTGDYLITLSNAYRFGYVPANDGTIGNAASNATNRANADTWPLYSLIWSTFLNNWAPVSTGRGANAYADFLAGKTITLTRSLGRVIAGANPLSNTPQTFTTAYSTSNFNLIVASSALFTTGTPVQLINTGGALPSALTSNTIYFAININATTIQLATSIENAYAAIAINMGSDQTGTSTIQSGQGIYTGESRHTQLLSEMPAHNHPGSTYAPYTNAQTAGSGGSVGVASDIGSPGLVLSIAMQGGGSAFNVLQPTVYQNIFFKL
jgi:hypothetical protein